MGLSRWEIRCTLASPEFRCVSTHRQMRKHRKGHWLLKFWQRIACCLLYIVYVVVAGVLTWQVWETIFPSQIWSKLSKLYFLLPNTVVITRVCSSLSLRFCCWKHSYFLCLIRNLLKVMDRRYEFCNIVCMHLESAWIFSYSCKVEGFTQGRLKKSHFQCFLRCSVEMCIQITKWYLKTSSLLPYLLTCCCKLSHSHFQWYRLEFRNETTE